MSRIRPVCVCGKKKTKNKSYKRQAGSWRATRQGGTRQPGWSKKYANVNYFVRNLLSCFEHTSPLADCTPSSPAAPPPLPSACHYVHEYSYSYSYSNRVCANNFVSYFNRHATHWPSYLILLPRISAHFPAQNVRCVLQVSVLLQHPAPWPFPFPFPARCQGLKVN